MRHIAGLAAPRSRRERARRVYVHVETLERRTLLSTSPLVIAGTAGSDTISVSLGSDGTLHATVNATTTNYTTAQYAGGIAIDTKAGGASGDSLSILSLPAVSTTVVSGGLLKATLGTDARGLQDIAATSLKLGGSTGALQLTANDSSDATARHLTLDAATASGMTYDVLHGLTPGDISAAAALLVVNLGNAGNTIDVNGTAPEPPSFAIVNLNTGNGNDTVNVHATAVGTILNINGQNGRDAVNVSGSDRTVANIQGVLNVSNPLGGTDLTIDDSGEFPGRTPAVTLDTFAAEPATYGTLQGLARAPINFAGTGLHSLVVQLSGITAPTLTVNDTPGGGAITFFNLASATVNGTAAGQSLSLHVSEAPGADSVTLNFRPAASGTEVSSTPTVSISISTGPPRQISS